MVPNMSKYLVYLTLKPFIAQWLRHHFGDPVVFPAQSAENACIRHFLTRQPGSLPLPRGDDDVAICIPDSKQKPVVTYNYLSGNARKAVAECIEDTFRLQLWRDLADIELCQCTLLSAVRAWCEANGIDVEYDYTLKMRFQRMRNSYLKHGIDLRRRSRVRDNKNC